MQRFLQQILRGREFEGRERAYWSSGLEATAEFEAQTQFKGRKGRVDILLYDKDQGNAIVVEIKATDWDSMASHRVRPNVLHHARQIWRYIEAELIDEWEVIPALVYPKTPDDPARKEAIEKALHERLIQVVWRDESEILEREKDSNQVTNQSSA